MQYNEDVASNIDRAQKIAKKYLEPITRLSGENLYDHAVQVFEKLKNNGVTDEDLLISALLHPLPEEDPEAFNKVKGEFSPEVSKIVVQYHKSSSISIQNTSPNKFNEAYIIQTYLNLTEDMRVLVLKLANKTSNIETAHTLPQELKVKVAERALFLYAPIAKLIAADAFAKTLENEAFKILDPSEYIRLKEIIAEKSGRLTTTLEETLPVLKELIEEKGINVEVSHRLKEIYSVHKKHLKYQKVGQWIGDSLEGIYDIAAARFIVEKPEHVYEVEDLIKSLWEEVPQQRDDYIAKPRPTGYRSLHNTFKIAKNTHVEVQIRTHEMHNEAEYGVCSHFFYKTGEKFKAELKNNPDWVKELNFWDQIKNKDQKDTKITHFSKYVYVFTPKGDIFELERSATALDFAYAVHTSIGHRCVGAKINGRICKIDTEVNDGDVIEIITSKGAKKPSRDWLQIVKTRQARWRILKGLRAIK